MITGIFTRGDLDGFFGLMVDNLIQLLVLTGICVGLCGFPMDFILSVVLPGASISLLFGNVLYGVQAYRLGIRTHRKDVTALPYGINTVSLFAFLFFVIFPVYQATGDYKQAWKAGLLASFASGLIEIAGSFFAGKIRKSTPRAALLSALAGIALTFISMDFLFRTFEHPLVTFLPLAVILVQYFGKVKFPLGLPGGFISVALGTSLAFLSPYWGGETFINLSRLSSDSLGLYYPKLAILDLFDVLQWANVKAYISVILPMGIFNVIGSLQNIESAEASGDSFDTRNSLLINGFGTLLGTFFGSPFPTTIYIGHPGWKALGAKYGYSILNGLFVTIISLFGLLSVLQVLIPVEAGMAIILWIGVVIAAQSFQSIPSSHSPAVVFGLLPAFAGWAVLIVQSVFQFLEAKLQGILVEVGAKNPYHFHLSDLPQHLPFLPYALGGVLALSQGFLLTSMVWASLVVFIIEREFRKAALWASIGAVLSFLGWIHSYSLSGNAILVSFSFSLANPFLISYLLLAIFFFLLSFRKGKDLSPSV